MGLPGSGKTTWAQNYIEEHPTTLRISRDSLREMLSVEYRFKKYNEKLILKLVKTCVRQSLLETAGTDRTVIIDDTNLVEKRRLSWVDIANRVGCYNVEFIYLDTPVKICKKRRKNTTKGTSGRDWANIIDEMDMWVDPPFTPREESTYKGAVKLRIVV